MELNRIHRLYERCRFRKRYWIAWQAFFEDEAVYISDPVRILEVQDALAEAQCCRTFIPKHYVLGAVEPESDTVRAVHSQVTHTAPDDTRSAVSHNTSNVAAEDYGALY
jgi:ribulose bisphosphate carboxylase small subunit